MKIVPYMGESDNLVYHEGYKKLHGQVYQKW